MADFYWLPYFDNWYDYFKKINGANVLPFVNGRKASTIPIDDEEKKVDGSDEQIEEELSYSYNLALNKVINLSAHHDNNIKNSYKLSLNINDISWSDIKDNDTLYILAHGQMSGPSHVCWKIGVNPPSTIKWSPRQMAEVIKNFLPGARFVHFKLLACFGANDKGHANPSFVKQLSLEMIDLELRGRLSGYKGATNIGVGQGHQTGSGRKSANIYIKIHGRTNPNGPTSMASEVVWPLLD